MGDKTVEISMYKVHFEIIQPKKSHPPPLGLHQQRSPVALTGLLANVS